jgi:maleate isomerase
LGSLNVKAALEAVSFDGIDAVVVSGTGMPSLPVIACDWAVPILSSNLCLAAQLLASVNSSAISDAGSLAINGWQKRLAEVMDN